MVALHQFPFVSVDEYLFREKDSPFRHEYDCGLMYAMAGASDDHIIIGSNLDTVLNTQLEETNCQPFPENMRVTRAGESYFYPDIVVTCGERLYEVRQDGKALLNPVVLIEISSDSTKAYDAGRKWEVYQRIPTLTDYLIVMQDRVHVTHWTQHEGKWASQDYTALTDEIALVGVAARLPLARVYKKVTWA